MKSNLTKNEKSEGVNDEDVAPRESIDVVSISGSVLRIKIYEARADEKDHVAIDFSEFVLPPVPFTGRVISFQERPELVSAIVKTVRGYIARVPESKSTHIVVGEMVRILVKFIEFGWLNGCYSLDDFAPSVTARFAQDIAEGGWAKALELDERMADLIKRLSPEVARTYVNSPTSKYSATIKRTLWQVLGTNMAVASPLGRELLFRAAGYVESDNRKRRWKQTAVDGTGANRLAIILATVNLLADDVENPSLDWVPFPNYSNLSDNLGRPGGRTPSLNPDHVARWLKESLRYVEQVGPALVETFAELRDQMAAQRAVSEMTPEARHRIFLASKGRRRLEEILGETLVGVARNATRENKTLREVTGAVMSACFSIIAILNARRKDEIQHRALGLNRASLALVDQGLDLYQCRFYIEKTHKGYLPFYVGQGTARAIELLNRLSDLTQDFVAFAKGPSYTPLEPVQRSLFQIPLLHFRATDKPAYLKFSTTEAAADLLSAALGDHGDIRVSAHMFRRAYALIFIYRYEHGDLMALSQQLGHFDLEMTLHYVTDGPLDKGSVTAGSFAQRSPDEFERWQEEISDLRNEIHAVGMERLEALVGEVIEGRENYSGIFVNLVRRFHQIHGRAIEYKTMGPKDQARALTKSLDERGHEFVPNRHGNCLASSTRKNVRAACYSSAEERLDRAEASANVCGACPYHLVSRAHVQNLESDATGLERSLAMTPKESVMQMVGAVKLNNLRRWIHLHKDRMGMDMGQAYATA